MWRLNPEIPVDLEGDVLSDSVSGRYYCTLWIAAAELFAMFESPL